MGMDHRCGDYLTGTNTISHPDHSRMEFLSNCSTADDGNNCPDNAKKFSHKTLGPIQNECSIATGPAHHARATDIVELIRTTRTNFETMIAVVRRNRSAPLKPSGLKDIDLEPLTGCIAHTFSNIFMAIQGRISLMLLRSGPEHAFFVQLKRLEKLVQSESILANDILPHITGRFFPLDRCNRQKLLDQITQIPSLMGVKSSSAANSLPGCPDSGTESVDSHALTESITCILNLLLSEIHKLTGFMMSQTASEHPDFYRLRGIKAYVQKGFDSIRDLYECTELVANEDSPTQPQQLVEIAFDAFFRLDSGLRLNVSVAENLWALKADATQIEKIIDGLYTLSTSAKQRGEDLYFTADNTCDTDSHGNIGHAGERYVVLSIGAAVQNARSCTGSKRRSGGHKKCMPISENDLGLVGVSSLIRSVGGRLSTVCPPGCGVVFNILMPAFRPGGDTESAQRPSDRYERIDRIIYLKSDKKAKAGHDRTKPCWRFVPSDRLDGDKTVQSSPG